MNNREDTYRFISDHLAEIAAYLPNIYRLTIVARHRGRSSANIVVSDDNLEAASEAIVFMKDDKTAFVSGPGEPGP